MDWQATSAVVSAIGILVNSLVAWRLATATRDVTIKVNELNRQTTLGVNEANRQLSEQLHESAIKRARREQLIPVWKEMLLISRIDPDDPNSDDFRTAYNLLNLVATCAELNIVEPSDLREMFGRLYRDVYSDLYAVNKPIAFGKVSKPGRDYVTDSPRLQTWFNNWSKEAKGG